MSLAIYFSLWKVVLFKLLKVLSKTLEGAGNKRATVIGIAHPAIAVFYFV